MATRRETRRPLLKWLHGPTIAGEENEAPDVTLTRAQIRPRLVSREASARRSASVSRKHSDSVEVGL